MKLTQHDRLLELLRKYDSDWCPLPEILKLMISQYGRVINDLRTGKYDGNFYNIENKTKWKNGQRFSWFRLLEAEPQRPENEELYARTNQHAEEKINTYFCKGKQFAFLG